MIGSVRENLRSVYDVKRCPCAWTSNYSLDRIFLRGYILYMAWEVEFTDEFGDWWNSLSETEQEDIAASVGILQEKGATLGFPHSSGIAASKHGGMRELRIQHQGRPYRVLYAFDPRRAAILLIGGDKTGNNRWYEEFVPVADKLFDKHLAVLEEEKKRK